MKCLLSTIRVVIGLVLATGILYSSVPSRKKKQVNAEPIIATVFNQGYPKGGIGIIIGMKVHVGLRSENSAQISEINQLLLRPGEDWTGKSSKEKQVVFVWEQKVFSADDLPQDFKLENSVIVSFEREKIFYFNFSTGKGGFYLRKIE